MSMLNFRSNEGTFNCRAAGVLIRNGKVLVNCWTPGGFYAFPGGRVELMEDSETAVVREFKEELGVRVHASRLLWVCELFFEHENQRVHEICFYYLLDLHDGEQLPEADTFEGKELDGSWMGFQWVPIQDAMNWDIHPHAVRDQLSHLPNGMQRLCVNEMP